MKSRHFPHPATCFFALTALAAFVSWMGSVYEWPGVRSLLGDEGLRWVLRTISAVYLHPPVLQVILILFLGLGLWQDSGLYKACKALCGRWGSLSRKEHRALVFSGIAFILYLGILLLLIFGPWGVACSVVGTFSGSPLADGFWCVLSLGIALPSIVYGVASDTYLNDRDVVRGMSGMFIRKSDCFVTLFFVLLFFSAMDYTGLIRYVGLTSGAWEWICWACCLILFLA